MPVFDYDLTSTSRWVMNLSAHIDSSKWNVAPRHLVSLEHHSAAFNYIGEQIWFNIERINTPPPNYYSNRSETHTQISVSDIGATVMDELNKSCSNVFHKTSEMRQIKSRFRSLMLMMQY